MYYRRKVLLALVESFGGTLKRTDCQKLLFLFCQYTNKNYYDFFPYKFGSFSFLVYQDKQRLIDLKYLRQSDDFELLSKETFYDQLKSKELSVLKSMKSEFGALRGKGLIRKVYLDYPQYACRSTIISHILTPDELDRTRRGWNTNQTPCLFTIGYEGITIDSYLNKLISNNIKALIDVRKNPISMKYGFSKTKLKHYVESAGLKYFHIPQLGIPSEMRSNLVNRADYQKLFQYYKSEILPKQSDAIEKVKNLHSNYLRTALTCYEADHRSCHRQEITALLQNDTSFCANILHL